ncbi:MAG: hypothetical protein AAF467_04215 [Actinomycetota bacterium]
MTADGDAEQPGDPGERDQRPPRSSMSFFDSIQVLLVSIWLVAFSLIAFYFTAILWSPALEFTEFEASQAQQIEEARETVTELRDEIETVERASEDIEQVQDDIEEENGAADTAAALAGAEEAVEAAEDALASVPPDQDNAVIRSAEAAVREAQDEVTEAAADASDATAAMAAVEAAEDAVDAAQVAVTEAATDEVEDVLQPAPERTIRVLGFYDWTLTPELVQLFLAMAGAGLGISAAALRGVTTIVGRDEWKNTWVGWHALRPVWGLAAAVIGYAAIRGGLLNINSSAATLNPFAVYAIGAILGMNASDTLSTLSRVMRPGGSPRPSKRAGGGQQPPKDDQGGQGAGDLGDGSAPQGGDGADQAPVA